jgi:AcrR family transcriptional regulator
VDEVTVFRHFGDMRTVAREALQRRMKSARWADVDLEYETSTPETTAAGISRVLHQMREGLRENVDLIEFAMLLSGRHPDLAEVIGPAPIAGRRLVRKALERASAADQLGPNVDLDASATTLNALLTMTVLWWRRGLLGLSDEEWDQLLAAAVRPLLNQVPH